MPTPDARFERELEIFRSETEQATQFYFALLAINDVARHDKMVHVLLNRTALFWNTCAGALQTSAFIALGRVFDKHSDHNVDSMLRIAQENSQVFSKAALARRLETQEPEKSQWVDQFVQHAYEPTPNDFRRLRAYVRKWRRIYEENYRDVRHKCFAHKEATEEAEVAELFRKGTNRELQLMLRFLGQLHRALWQLFFNGRKPILRPARYSVAQMRKRPALRSYSGVGIQEHITPKSRLSRKLMKATPSAASSARALTRCFKDLPNRSIFQTRIASNRRRQASAMSRLSAGLDSLQSETPWSVNSSTICQPRCPA